MDTKVLMTQQWLNETYAGTSGYSAVDEDGITGMGTIRALIWALQTELGISADGVFGDSYSAGCIVLQGAGSRSHLS